MTTDVRWSGPRSRSLATAPRGGRASRAAPLPSSYTTTRDTTRTVFPTTPQRVDYELTKLGATLWEAVEPLGSWARAHMSEILRSRQQFDGRR
ncbi:MAG: winged helix-turn-helix transcriptional regulator [Caulobacteraceae bacterium]